MAQNSHFPTTGGSQVDRKSTERVYAGGKDIERVEDGPDSAEERGWA